MLTQYKFLNRGHVNIYDIDFYVYYEIELIEIKAFNYWKPMENLKEACVEREFKYFHLN